MEKITSIILSLVIALSFLTIGASALTSDDGYVLGDINSDESLDIADVVIARAYIIGTKELSYKEFVFGDLNGDEVIDIIDIAIMRKTIVENAPKAYNEFLDKGYYISEDIRSLVDNATLSPHYDYYIYEGTKADGKVFQHITLNENDIMTLNAFAATHFCNQNSISEKMYVTHQWIHYNNDYAYAGEKWNTIESKTYVDAIFNYKLGQCIQYNGAMAGMLAYYGFNVWMEGISGVHWTTYVEINGTTYHIECGNYGKNGTWQDFFSQDLALR